MALCPAGGHHVSAAHFDAFGGLRNIQPYRLKCIGKLLRRQGINFYGTNAREYMLLQAADPLSAVFGVAERWCNDLPAIVGGLFEGRDGMLCRTLHNWIPTSGNQLASLFARS